MSKTTRSGLSGCLSCYAVLLLLVSGTALGDANWDGDNATGNFSYNNNWYGDVGPASGFGNSLWFNYHNNGSASSIYYDWGWASFDNIYWASTFSYADTFNGNGNGINFNTRIENQSGSAQIVNIPLSGAKNGSSDIQLNPVSGDLTLQGPVYNDNNKPYNVWGNNGKTLTLSGSGDLKGNSSATLTIQQNSTVKFASAQTFAGNVTILNGTLRAAMSNPLAAQTIYLGDTTGANGANINLDGGYTLTNAITVQTGSSGAKTIANTASTSGTATFAGSLLLNDNAKLYANSGGSLSLPATQTGASLNLNGKTLTIDGSGSVTVAGGLSGSSGALTLAATAGTVTLSGPNSYTGATTVNGGTLICNGTNTSSAVTVNSGGTLMGSGSIGNLTLATGSTNNPGNSGVGKLRVTSLTMNNGSVFRCEIGDCTSLASVDCITNTGTFSVSATAKIMLDSSLVSNWASNSTSYSWVIITNSSAAASVGNFALDSSTAWTPGLGGGLFNLAASGNSVLLTFTPVPQSVAATKGTSTTQITVSWADAPGETGYKVYRNNANNHTGETQIGGTLAANTTSYNDTSAVQGTTYYYWVKAATAAGDTGYSSSDSGNLFQVPTSPSSAITISGKSATGVTVGFTPGNGSTHMVVMRQGSAVAWTPTDNTDYSGGVNANFTTATDLGGTTKIVYSGSGSSVAVSGLTAGTQYYITVYEFNSSGSLYAYYTSGAPTSNTTTWASEPTTQPSGLGFSPVSSNSMSVTWSGNGNGAAQMVIMKAGSAVDVFPSDATSYTANSSFGAGGALGGGNYIVYSGSGSPAAVSGLTPNTTYYVAVIGYNGSGATANYYTNSPLTGSQTSLDNVPIITYTPGSVAVTAMVGSAISSASLFVTNSGGSKLCYTVASSATSWLNVTPTAATNTLNAGTTHTISFTTTGLGACTSNGTITVQSVGTGTNAPVTASAAVTVSMTLTNIPAPTSVSATANGKELVNLTWTSGYQVLVVYQAGSDPATAPTPGTAYTVGQSIGGGTVIYNASGAGAFAHMLPAGTDAHYTLYAVNGSYYSPGLSPTHVQLGSYGTNPTEIVDPFDYTNGATLSGLSGGSGFTAGWSESNTGAYTVVSGSFGTDSAYPTPSGNKILVDSAPGERKAFRTLSQTVTNGSLYVAFYMNCADTTAGRYCGLSLFDGGAEKGFFGKQYSSGSKLGVSGSSGVDSTYTLTGGSGNDYIVIGRYVFSNSTLSVLAYYAGSGPVAVPTSEPASWSASTSASITQITAIRLAAGWCGNTYFDEVRLARSWSGLLNQLATRPTTNPTVGAFTSVTGTGMTINWSGGNGSSNLVVVRDGAASTNDPYEGASYTASATFASGQALGGGYVVFCGPNATSSVAVSGLTAGHTYYVTVYAFGGSGGTENYLTASPGTGNATTAVTPPSIQVTPASISVTSMVGSAVSAQNFYVTNSGAGSLSFTLAASDSWLWPSLSSGGPLAASAGAGYQVTFNTAGLLACTSNGTITVTDSGSTPAAANSPQQLPVHLTLTNIPSATSFTATASGKEMINLVWGGGGSSYLLVCRAGADPTALTQNHTYAVGDAAGNGTVLYSGSGTSFGHVVPTGSDNHYALYVVNNGYYSAAMTAQATTGSYGLNPTEIVAPFSYTNAALLDGCADGSGWSGPWSNASHAYVIDSGSFTTVGGYPAAAGYRAKVASGGGETAFRNLASTVSTGKIYIAYWMRYTTSGTGRWCGLSLFDGATEKIFLGKISSQAQQLGIGINGGGETYNNYTAYEANDWLVIGKYDFAAQTVSVTAFHNGDTLPATEATLTYNSTRSSVAVPQITAIRLGAGSVGDVYFDEVRVASSYAGLLNQLAPRPSTDPSALTLGGVTASQMTLGWTKGNGANCLVVARAGSAVSWSPSEGEAYTGNNDFTAATDQGSGNKVVYSGSATSVAVNNLSAATTYYFKVFGYNGDSGSNNYYTAGSPAVTNRSTLAAEPGSQASNIVFSSIGQGQMTANWTSGNGAARIAVVKSGSAPGAPTDGVAYSVGDSVGGGTVAYAGTGSSTVLSNLSASTVYYLEVFEYNGSGATANYNANTANNNPSSQSTTTARPTQNPTSLTFSSIGSTSLTVNWSGGDGSSNIVVMKDGSALAGDPVDGTSYAASTVLGSGAALGGGSVVYVGGSGSVSVTGLQAGHTYYVNVYALNGSGGTESYLTTSPTSSSQATTLPAPSTAATSITISSLGASGMTLGWTSGNGASRLVVVRPATAVAWTPSANTAYVANANFAAGTDLGDGSKVVYNGSGSQVTISGLSASTAYYATIYEYSNYSSLYSYLTAGAPVSNATTWAAEPSQASGVSITGVSTTGFTVNWTGAGENQLVLVKQGGAVDGFPTDTSSYSANAALGGGTQIGSGNYVVYNGNGGPVLVTNLTPNTTYGVAVVSYNGAAGLQNYNTNSAPGTSTNTLDVPPIFALSTGSISVTAQVGSNPSAAGFAVTNIGGSHMSYSIQETNSWMSILPTAGTNVVANGNRTHTVSFDTTGLAAGTYHGSILITSTGAGQDAATNSPQTISVTMTLTTLGLVTGASATADGNELVRLAWDSGYTVLVVYTNSAAPSDGTTYNAGDSCGGGTVLYKGTGTSLEQVVQPGTTNAYSLYVVNGSTYSTATSVHALTGTYGTNPLEIVEPFAYVTGDSLNGKGGGHGFSGAWSVSSGTFTVDPVSLGSWSASGSPSNAANKITVASPAGITAVRSLSNSYTNGSLYISFIMNYSTKADGNWGGLSFLNDGSEVGFFGKVSGSHSGANDWLGLSDGTAATTYSNYHLNTGWQQDYLVLGKYDFAQGKLYVKALSYAGQQHLLNATEITNWDATMNASIGKINGLRMAASGTGATYFDEIRLSTSWLGLLNLTVPNAPTSVSVTTSGPELNRLSWTRNGLMDAMVVASTGGALSAPVNGHTYAVGDACGGGTVIYIGQASSLEQVVTPGSTNTYRFYSNDGTDNFSAPATVAVTNISYGVSELVDSFAYTNGTTLAGCNGGHGWSGAWTESTPGSYAVDEGSFAAVNGAPSNYGNKVHVSPASGTSSLAYRSFPTVNSGKLYVSFLMNYQTAQAAEYAGLSLMNGGVEQAFFGKVYASADKLGVSAGSDVTSTHTLTPGSGNDYVIIGMYDFAAQTLKVQAFFKTNALPLIEPASWDATKAWSIGQITGIRLASGGDSGRTPGNTYFDEIRVATNWADIVEVASPDSQASNVAASHILSRTMDISWARGNGTGCLAVAKAGSAPTGVPADKVDYTANSTYGAGDLIGDAYVIYKGTGNSVTLSGLEIGTTYYIQVFEYNGGADAVKFLTSTATGNPGHGTTPQRGSVFFFR